MSPFQYSVINVAKTIAERVNDTPTTQTSELIDWLSWRITEGWDNKHTWSKCTAYDNTVRELARLALAMTGNNVSYGSKSDE